MQSTLGVLVAATALLGAFAACSDDDAPSSPVVADAGASTVDSGSQDAGNAGASLGAGPYALVYAGTEVGVDMRNVADGKATFDGAKLLSYEASADERPALGTNQVHEAASDSLVAIGRWSGGATSGKFYEIAGTGLIALPANGGFHYAIGKFLDPLPASGGGTYTELMKTSATVSDGSVAPGTISGSLAANFSGATSKIGFSITLDVPGDATYTLATTGGVANVATSEAEVLSGGELKGIFSANLQLTSSGAACGGSCAAAVDGFVAGPNAERIGIVAHVYKGSGGSPTSIAGAIVFKK